ncbi:MAG: PHP domain-containing protein [Longimicrobiales bacterium]
MRIDLHLHSTASDGSLTPGVLVRTAAGAGLDIIALTDHDTVAGVDEASSAAAGAVHVIHAIEMSATHDAGELHVLGYFIDASHPALIAYSGEAVRARRTRMHGMLKRLERLGVRVEYEEVAAAAGPDGAAIGRPHLARALVQRGYVQSFADAFDRYIGDRAPAFLPTELLSARAAIELIHTTGGVAVWAHPRASLFHREIRRFAGWGLDGVECFRPRSAPEECLAFETTTRALGMLVTGGSDWHGEWHGRLGEFSMSRDEVGAFLARGGI